jgi:RNA polymerase sigma-70 factor (ECF subfamily)
VNLRRSDSDELGAEQDLLRELLAGTPGAGDRFAKRFQPVIEACIRRLSRSYGAWMTSDDMQDVAGEVWVALFENDLRRLRRYDPGRHVKVSTWIGLLARHCAVDWFRAARGRAAALEALTDLQDGGSSPDTPAQLLDRRERVHLAGHAVMSLTDKERRFLADWYSGRSDGKTLARRLGVAPGTVYARRFKIISKLQERISADEGGGLFKAAS